VNCINLIIQIGGSSICIYLCLAVPYKELSKSNNSLREYLNTNLQLLKNMYPSLVLTFFIYYNM